MSADIEQLLKETKEPMKPVKRSYLLGEETCKHGIELRKGCTACDEELGLE